jgi:PAS domain S-box-containing protein
VLVDINDGEEAAETRALLASIVESSEEAIISKALDGSILSWNAGAERLLGYTAEEMVGRNISSIIPPDRQAEESALMARVRRGERIEPYETVRVTKDGRRLDIFLTISPIRDAAGRIVGVSKVARDITARKQAQENILAATNALARELSDLKRLNALSCRLATTLDLKLILQETLRTAMAIEGADSGLLLLWDAKQGSLRVEATHGFDEAFIESLGGVAPKAGAWRESFDQGRRVVMEDLEHESTFARYARRGGFRAVHCTPLIARSTKVIGVLATHFRHRYRPADRQTHLVDLCARQAVDFIENARVHARLKAADRRKDEFLATLSHELRNPIGPLRHAVEILRASKLLSAEARRALDVIDRQSQQMTRLVDDLMDSARVTSNKLELRREPVELADILRMAVETSQTAIDADAHELFVDVSEQAIYVDGDAARLAQVVSNLLNNAAKYMQAGGRIWLSGEQQDGQAVIRVRDAGIGIDAEVLPGIFEMFAQADDSLDRSQGGLGIGLSVAKQVVEMHGGTISAHSDGLGKGSEFVVRLPAIGEPDADLVPTLQYKPAVVASSLRVLVVDDNQDATDMLALLLERVGYEVLTSEDAAHALELVEVHRPDVVLMDIGMPGMDGYEAAKIIRGSPWGKNLVLIATTGWALETDTRRSKDAGFDHHFVKPIDSTALIQLLASLKRTDQR